MKLNVLVLVLALAATALSGFAASAQVVIEERRDPAVVIEKDRPAASVTVEHDRPVTEKKVIKETTGTGGCDSKTVHKEGLEGSKTVTKTNCD